jgi:hypothetical protein
MFGSGCGSNSDDTTARSQPDQDDDASEADEGDANEADDDAAGSDRTNADEGDSGAGSTATSSVPDDESIDSLCNELCEAWTECEEAGGAECVDECNGFTASSTETGCYPLVQALYDCILAADECPEQAGCETEADALARCTNGGDDSSGGTSLNPPSMAGGSGTGSSSVDSGGSGSGGTGTGPSPSASDDAPPIDSEDVDPAEHFGGEDSTPEAILAAEDLPQCSEFEVDEFECGGSGYSSGGALCTVDCYDPDDRVWSSLCRDGICRCQYEGITYCQCAHEGMTDNGCNSCCPQLTDADFDF